MNRRKLIKSIAIISAAQPLYPLLTGNVLAQNRDDQDDAFQQWKKQQLQDFNDYKDFYTKAFNDYKAGVEVDWGKNPIYRSRKTWVDYSQDTKRLIDFDEGFAEVSVIFEKAVDETKAIGSKLTDNVSEVASEVIDNITDTAGEVTDAAANIASSAINTASKAADYAKGVLKDLFKQDGNSVLAADKLEQALDKQLKKSNWKLVEADKKTNTTPIFSPVQPSQSAIEKAPVKEQVLSNGNKVVTIKVPINNSIKAKVQPLLPDISVNAKQYNISEPLICSIIETESAFNPLAKSPVPAFGLMQIVPTSAGIDVSEYLLKEKRVYTSDWLYNPSNNVLAGSTYMHLLLRRYLKDIDNDQSRIYCAIASYNTGAGNMAKAFSRRGLTKAIQEINTMSPDDVYQQLVKKLPYKETRDYVARVVKRMDKWDNRLS